MAIDVSEDSRPRFSAFCMHGVGEVGWGIGKRDGDKRASSQACETTSEIPGIKDPADNEIPHPRPRHMYSNKPKVKLGETPR
jgi:hypothetical protein